VHSATRACKLPLMVVTDPVRSTARRCWMAAGDLDPTSCMPARTA
jgi:hypothetical protein